MVDKDASPQQTRRARRTLSPNAELLRSNQKYRDECLAWFERMLKISESLTLAENESLQQWDSVGRSISAWTEWEKYIGKCPARFD
jgi:hypothetical protein